MVNDDGKSTKKFLDPNLEDSATEGLLEIDEEEEKMGVSDRVSLKPESSTSKLVLEEKRKKEIKEKAFETVGQLTPKRTCGVRRRLFSNLSTNDNKIDFSSRIRKKKEELFDIEKLIFVFDSNKEVDSENEKTQLSNLFNSFEKTELEIERFEEELKKTSFSFEGRERDCLKFFRQLEENFEELLDFSIDLANNYLSFRREVVKKVFEDLSRIEFLEQKIKKDESFHEKIAENDESRCEEFRKLESTKGELQAQLKSLEKKWSLSDSAVAELRKELFRLEKEKKDFESKNIELKKNNEQNKGDASVFKEQADRYFKEIITLGEKNNSLAKQLFEKKNELEELKKQNSELLKKLQEIKKEGEGVAIVKEKERLDIVKQEASESCCMGTQFPSLENLSITENVFYNNREKVGAETSDNSKLHLLEKPWSVQFDVFFCFLNSFFIQVFKICETHVVEEITKLDSCDFVSFSLLDDEFNKLRKGFVEDPLVSGLFKNEFKEKISKSLESIQEKLVVKKESLEKLFSEEETAKKISSEFVSGISLYLVLFFLVLTVLAFLWETFSFLKDFFKKRRLKKESNKKKVDKKTK